MSIINTISGASSAINIGGSALSLVGLGAALFKNKSIKRGIEGFLFDVPLTENVTFQANITDHYTEDNSSIQDHIAFDPIKITLTGKVAELVHSKQAGLAFLSAMIDRLQPLGLFSPKQGLQAQRAISAAHQAISAIDTLKKTYTSLADIFSDRPSLNNQQKAFKLFSDYFETRSLLSVETPWETYEDMAIESWSADQNADTTMETTFTITLKQMRFVETNTFAGSLLGRIGAQKSGTVNKGTQKGSSAAASGFDAIKNFSTGGK